MLHSNGDWLPWITDVWASIHLKNMSEGDNVSVREQVFSALGDGEKPDFFWDRRMFLRLRHSLCRIQRSLYLARTSLTRVIYKVLASRIPYINTYPATDTVCATLTTMSLICFTYQRESWTEF
jgi:hypothetical protein